MRNRVTITDVAKLCGVTPATVSRVLNGKKNFSASDAVRQRIRETAEKLGYVPDLSARNLHRKSTRIIGLFASPFTHLSEGINESLLDGIAEVLHADGYDVFFDLAPEKARREGLPFWRFDGAILFQAPKPETVLELDRRRMTYVCVNDSVGAPAAAVLADDVMGMQHAVEHLAALGHRKIAYANARVGYFIHYSLEERLGTLKQSVKEHGLALAGGADERYVPDQGFVDRVIRHEGATAIISYDHHIALMLISEAQKSGLRMPEDFSLLCFNDAFPTALLPTPLTAVAVSGREMGRIGATRLLDALSGKVRADAQREIRVPEQLVIRASTVSPTRSR